jgi:hypothetical protein
VPVVHAWHHRHREHHRALRSCSFDARSFAQQIAPDMKTFPDQRVHLQVYPSQSGSTQVSREVRPAGEQQAIGIDLELAIAHGTGRAHDIEQFRMQRGLAAGELERRHRSLGLAQLLQRRGDLRRRQIASAAESARQTAGKIAARRSDDQGKCAARGWAQAQSSGQPLACGMVVCAGNCTKRGERRIRS